MAVKAGVLNTETRIVVHLVVGAGPRLPIIIVQRAQAVGILCDGFVLVARPRVCIVGVDEEQDDYDNNESGADNALRNCKVQRKRCSAGCQDIQDIV